MRSPGRSQIWRRGVVLATAMLLFASCVGQGVRPAGSTRVPSTGVPPTAIADPSASVSLTPTPIAPAGATPTSTIEGTRIRDVQGRRHVSPLDGTIVRALPGIVTAKRNDGFYLQDPRPDDDEATSEGVFVFTGGPPTTVSAGDAVEVTGRVNEVRPGGRGDNLSVTEVTAESIRVVSSGNPLPVPVTIGSAGRQPPRQVIDDDVTGDAERTGTFDPPTDGLDFYESLEGMLVQVVEPVVVGPRNRFGEIVVLADDGGHASGRNARGGITIQTDDLNPERIFLDDELLRLTGQATPAVNVGDGFAGPVVGVIDYSFGNYKVQLTRPMAATRRDLPREVTALAATDPSHLAVATLNVENLDPTDAPTRFADLAQVVVQNLRSPDLLALEEIQDDNGPRNDRVVSAGRTARMLIDAITTAGGPAYQYRDVPPVDDRDGGEPGGNIRVGLLFRTDRGLAFVDRPGGGSTVPVSVVAENGAPRLSHSPGRIDPQNPAFVNSRKPLVGELTFGGRRLFVIANHFVSKGGDQPLFGRYQPPTRSSGETRAAQARVVQSFVGSLLTADLDAAVIVLGDLNDFPFSETLRILTRAGLTNLLDGLAAEEQYTYVFEGNAQALDHILVSPALRRDGRPEVDVVHLNAEYAIRTSDHDPLVARFVLAGR